MKFIVMLPSPTDQFEVSNIIGLTGEATNGALIGLTNFGLYSLLVAVLVIGLHLMADNDSRLVPSYWSVVVETIYASVQSFSVDQLGVRNMQFFPFIYALFVALLFTNLVGNVPYSFTLSSTAIMTMGLSFTVFFGVTLMGLLIHRLHFFSYFIPSGTPLALVPLLTLIELISYLARAVSLGVRLAANMIAGHMLLAILASFLFGLFTTSVFIGFITLVPFMIFTALIVLELAVSAIQSYVFCTLVASYIHDAIELHLN